MFSDENSVYLVLELAWDGEQRGINLLEFLKTRLCKAKRKEDMVKEISRGILEGISYMHSMNIVHWDIKLENIIVNETTLAIKVIDFGFALRLEMQEDLFENLGTLPKSENSATIKSKMSQCGTPSYMAPEIIWHK